MQRVTDLPSRYNANECGEKAMMQNDMLNIRSLDIQTDGAIECDVVPHQSSCKANKVSFGRDTAQIKKDIRKTIKAASRATTRT